MVPSAKKTTQSSPPGKRPLDQLAEKKSVGLAAEYWAFVKHNKKWWLVPIIAVLMLIGALVLLGGTAAAPFVYTLF